MNDETHQWTLSAADAAAADAVLNREVSAGRDGQRAEKIAELLKVLAAAPAPAAPADLLERTLGRVSDERMKIGTARTAGQATEKQIDHLVRRRWSQRLTLIGSMAIAASLLIAVTMMGLGQAHESRMRTLCYENLKQVSAGFAAYGGDFRGALPSLVTPASENWLANTGDGPRRNSANLLPLVTGKYVALANLYCASVTPATLPEASPEKLGEIGYSYTHLYSAARPTWDGRATTIVLADKNPVFSATPPAKPDVNSTNHGGHGNYILTADGTVTWAPSPNVGPGGDNIWTVARGAERVMSYVGTEKPSGAGDVFLCP